MRLLVDRARTFALGGPSGDDDLAAVIDVTATVSPDGQRWSMTIGNPTAVAVPIRRIGWVVPLEVHGPLRIFCNGYQSWSPTGVATLGVDRDPSTSSSFLEVFGGALHADQRQVQGDELRSELFTVLADGSDDIVVAGFSGGDRHDGTFRVRNGAGGPELVIEAFLGGAHLPVGGERVLHDVLVLPGATGEHSALLDRWATDVGRAASARVEAPYQVGWCSWYHYFHKIDEAALDANLALAGDWPFDVFQLDDGYQPAIGDWLRTNDTFDSDLDAIAARISAAGRRPGIWLAPFSMHPNYEMFGRHPEWLATTTDGAGPIPSMIQDIWDGVAYALDVTRPEVLDHLEGIARGLHDAGFSYLKLDFTYAPSFDGIYADMTQTPAERVRAAFAAIRRGAGDDAFLLGCGAPLANVLGLVDGMRIGPDVAPNWEPSPDHVGMNGYEETSPSTRNAWQSTLARSFMHRRFWLNDPDCIMLRTEHTDLAPESARAWALAVGASGGMALVSDDLSLLGPAERELLDEVVTLGRMVDDEIRAGAPAPSSPDLMDHRTPTTLVAGRTHIVGTPDAGTAELHHDREQPTP